MLDDDFTEFLNSEVIRHNDWLPGILPAFFLDDSDLTESMINQQKVNSSTDGHEIIQAYLERNPEVYDGERPVAILEGEWTAKYHYIHDGWVFSKTLDYERIFAESLALEEVIKNQLKNKIKSTTPENFEYLLFEIFSQLDDYGDPTKRPHTRDGGYEMVVTRPHKITGNKEHILVQAKHQRRKVSVGQTRELIGTLDVISGGNRSKRVSGLMISLKGATPDAQKTAEKSSFQIDFIDLEALVKIMYRYKIGWHSRDLRFATLDERFWEEWGED